MLEKELYESVKLFLEDLGFRVQAEVKDCDVVGQKGEDLVIVELKRNLSVRLLTQAVQRQKLGADVYVAIPKPTRYKYDKKHRELLHLLRRLELGLLFVTPEKQLVEAALHPQPLDLKQVLNTGKKKRKVLEKELELRQFNINQGGSSKTKIMTAYREQALFLCCALSEAEPCSARELALLIGVEQAKVSAMLRRNYYGWFEQPKRGEYCLTEEGRNAINQYPAIAAFYFEKLHREAEEGEE